MRDFLILLIEIFFYVVLGLCLYAAYDMNGASDFLARITTTQGTSS